MRPQKETIVTGLSGTFVSSVTRVLIMSSTDWVWPVKLAEAFAAAGATVACTAPPRTPLMRALPHANRHRLVPANPIRSIARAIEATAAHAVIACDDRIVWYLQRLYRACNVHQSSSSQIVSVLERSIGSAIASEALLSRSALLNAAREECVASPDSMPLLCDADVDLWGAHAGYPAFVKADGTAGGIGVVEVGDGEQVRRAIDRFQKSMRPINQIGKFLAGRGAIDFWDCVQQRGHAVSIQAKVSGNPANILVCCQQGSVLASIAVEVLECLYPNGPARVVRVVQSDDMLTAAARIVRRFGLSGFVGFDFIIETTTGRAQLIEMNPRATGLSCFATADALDPVGCYCCAILGLPSPLRQGTPIGAVLTLSSVADPPRSPGKHWPTRWQRLTGN